ncbi:MAG TPA: hypothetical protein VFY22_11655, partial [Hydrogenophaga sp.]|nr:hypothetical protein [Hydrogenophaga sp.]
VSFHCGWLVAMSEKQGHGVRVGCGRYDWLFNAASGLADDLVIRIDAMQSLPPPTLTSVMDWVTRLPYPWCEADIALHSAPGLAALAPVLDSLAEFHAIPRVTP